MPLGVRPTPRRTPSRRTASHPASGASPPKRSPACSTTSDRATRSALVAALAPSMRARGRIRLLEAWAALGAGDLGRVDAILAAGLEIADLREGERSIDQLWRAAFPDRDVPAEYDFRMVAD